MANKKKVVILIEDDPDITMLANILLSREYEVISYTYPLATMTKEAWAGVDVAVIDLMLPGVTGEIVLEWMEIHVPGVKRIVYTATLPSLIPSRVSELAYTVLHKPDDIMKLGEVL